MTTRKTHEFIGETVNYRNNKHRLKNSVEVNSHSTLDESNTIFSKALLKSTAKKIITVKSNHSII